MNVAPGFFCMCPEGYDGNGYDGCYIAVFKKTCTDDRDCVKNARCSAGKCCCQDGFEANGSECHDVDECLDPDYCGVNAHCTNTLGGALCECRAGYVKYPPSYNCVLDNSCKKVGDKHQCQCDKGYKDVPGLGCCRDY